MSGLRIAARAAAAGALMLLGGFAAPALAGPLPQEAIDKGAVIEAQDVASEPKRIAVLSFQGSAFWEAVDEGINAAQAYLKDYNTQVDYIQLGTALTAEAIVAGIDGALAQQYDAIVTIPIFDGTVAKINEAVASGVPVLSFIADSAQRSNRTVGMGTLAYDAGAKAGRFIIDHLGCKGKIGVITGYLGAAQHNDRMNGALDLIKKECPEIEIIGPFESKDDDATAFAQANDLMTNNPDLSIIYVTAGGSTASARAVRDAGATGKVGVVGYDILPDKTIYLEGGEMLALVDQAPFKQAFDSIVMAHNIIVSGTEYPADIAVDAVVATGKGAKQ